MKRREFLSSAGALATLPVLPMPAAAVPAAAAPANALQASWAALFARAHGQATPALIQKWLGVGPAQAQALMSDLLAKNVIAAPVAGSAASVQPMFPKTGIPGVRQTSDLLAKTRDVIEYLAEDHNALEAEEHTDDIHEPT